MRHSIRTANYHTQRLAQRWRFRQFPQPAGGWPILLGISFPKSGTNLLRQVLAGFCKTAPFSDRSYDVFAAFDPLTGEQRPAEQAHRYLEALRPGDIGAAHLLTWPSVVEQACRAPFIPYFIYRDPRDVVVSHVFYVTQMANEHIHHRYYTDVLTTFEERLRTSILGKQDTDVNFPDIGKRFQPYRGWVDRPEVLPIRFEDLIEARQPTLERVIEHFQGAMVEFEAPRSDLLTALESNIAPQRSPTFRSGKTGEWRKHFNAEHKQLFKEVAGDLLIQLGYESDHDW